MVTIKIPGMKDVELTAIQFNQMAQALQSMVLWGSSGMFGDGDKITNKQGMARAKVILKKLGYIRSIN